MFVVDFISASVLAVVLTIVFAALFQRRGYRRARDMSSSDWLMLLASWVAGIGLVAFGPAITGTHWLAFAVAGFLVGLLVLGLRKLPKFRRSLRTAQTETPDATRSAVALYFCVTVLLFFCAVSLRFYLVHLS